MHLKFAFPLSENAKSQLLDTVAKVRCAPRRHFCNESTTRGSKDVVVVVKAGKVLKSCVVYNEKLFLPAVNFINQLPQRAFCDWPKRHVSSTFAQKYHNIILGCKNRATGCCTYLAHSQ